MKKIATLSLAASTLFSSVIFCMHRTSDKTLLLALRTPKCKRTYYSSCINLPPKNIFNTPEKDLTKEKTLDFLQDLWERNRAFGFLLHKQSDLLEQQQDIIVSYVNGHSEQLNVETLQILENQLQSTSPENFIKRSKPCYRDKNHTNE